MSKVEDARGRGSRMQLGDMVGENNQQQQLGDSVGEHNQQQQQVYGTQPEITWEVIYAVILLTGDHTNLLQY